MLSDDKKTNDDVDSEGKKAALDTAIADGEKDELKDNAEFNKEKQRADQESANARKARAELDQTTSKLTAAQTENATLKQELEDMKAKALEAGIETVDLKEDDYEGTDLKLVQAIKSLEKKLKLGQSEITKLNKSKNELEQQIKNDRATKARLSQYEQLLASLDDDYGADCRNSAVKKFSELSANGKVPKGDPVQATRIMEKCYKEAKAEITKAKKDAEKKNKLSLDPGSGGGARTSLSGIELKKGSLDEVAAQAAGLSIKAPEQ